MDTLLDFALKTWGKTFIEHAWEDFWVYDEVPDDMPSTPEFDTMFVPWFVLGFVPVASDDSQCPEEENTAHPPRLARSLEA